MHKMTCHEISQNRSTPTSPPPSMGRKGPVMAQDFPPLARASTKNTAHHAGALTKNSPPLVGGVRGGGVADSIQTGVLKWVSFRCWL